jgi:thiamine-monophosphate kinase
LGDGRLLALTVDTVLEEVAVGLYRDPFTTGRTSVISSLSDLAAVGADPLGLLMAVGLPEGDATVQEQLALGIRDACEAAGTYVLGGDTGSTPTLQVGCLAAGLVPEDGVLTRIGARPSDHLFVSGGVGLGAALAAHMLLGIPKETFSELDFRPMPTIKYGKALRGVASACMDTSDGLLSALDQLARLNEVEIRLQISEETLHPRAEATRQAAGLPVFPFLASYHGEFELVFSVPEDRIEALAAAAAGIGWSPIPLGRVEKGEGLFLGNIPVDGSRVRNLLEDCGGDLGRYVAELLGMGLP